MEHSLIVAYLEGRLPLDKEKELYEQISASEEAFEEFRAVEKEWKGLHRPSARARLLLERIHQEEKEALRKKRRGRIFLYAAAISALVVASVALLTDVFSHKAPERIFVETPNGSNSNIVLPDGTHVWLNAGTVLGYDTRFNKKNRRVDIQGEAYFEVARNEHLPFVVEARGCSLTVKGTKFDVQAYESNAQVEAVLMEGSLLFQAGDKTCLMQPNDLVSYDLVSESIRQEQVRAHQYKAWIDGVIMYDNITLPVLCNKLSKEFDVEICLETTAFDSRRFRVAFQSGETLDTILKALETILPISVVHTDHQYLVDDRY